MRRFSAAYLADTREGLWSDRAALAQLDLSSRDRILDVGSGIGSLANVFKAETDAQVVCLDLDRSLLRVVDELPSVAGDATRLPVAAGSFDLVACQALLVNLHHPAAAVREFARVSSEVVVAVEPDNSGVTIESTVSTESALTARARAAYLSGLATDASLGSGVADVFDAVGLQSVTAMRHDLVRIIEPPYEPRDMEGARRKIAASRLADHEVELRAGGLSAGEFDQLVAAWRAMGRDAVRQIRADEYRRVERVPCYVTMGRV